MKENKPRMETMKKGVRGDLHPPKEVGYLIYCPTEGELENDFEDDSEDDLEVESEDGFIEDFGEEFIEDVKGNIKMTPSNQDESSNAEITHQSSAHEFVTERAQEVDERDLLRLEVDIVVKEEPSLSEDESESQFETSHRENFRSDQLSHHGVNFGGQSVAESETMDATSSYHNHGRMGAQGLTEPDQRNDVTANRQMEKSFVGPTKTNLPKTTEIQTGEKTHQCPFCDRTFTQSCNLTIHKRRHTGDRPFQCSLCQKRFYSKSILSVHERSHTGERPYKCSFCNKGFTQWSNLSQHWKTHTGEKTHQCTICNKSFSQSSILNRHMRTHSGERPYRCSVCSKAFSFEYNLERHMPIHTGEKPYKCKLCSKEYTHRSSLSAHLRTHRKVKNTTNQRTPADTPTTIVPGLISSKIES